METTFDQYPFLLVVDLEAKCDDHAATPCLVPKHQMETIEIGAVLVDTTTLEPVGELGLFVRPVRHPILTTFCRTLTTMTQADVDGAPRFPAAVASVERFLAGRRALFGSWGDYDARQLAQDAAHHNVRVPWAKHHVNLKRLFSAALGETKRFGMAEALRRVGLTLDGTHHRGLDDARNIAQLLPWMAGRRGE